MCDIIILHIRGEKTVKIRLVSETVGYLTFSVWVRNWTANTNKETSSHVAWSSAVSRSLVAVFYSSQVEISVPFQTLDFVRWKQRRSLGLLHDVFSLKWGSQAVTDLCVRLPVWILSPFPRPSLLLAFPANSSLNHQRSFFCFGDKSKMNINKDDKANLCTKGKK